MTKIAVLIGMKMWMSFSLEQSCLTLEKNVARGAAYGSTNM